MTESAQDILNAAGVECAEVDALGPIHYHDDAMTPATIYLKSNADAAILALARLVAKYKGFKDQTESLQVCANCRHFTYEEIDYEGGHCYCQALTELYVSTPIPERIGLHKYTDPNPSQHCMFDPSKWESR